MSTLPFDFVSVLLTIALFSLMFWWFRTDKAIQLRKRSYYEQQLASLQARSSELEKQARTAVIEKVAVEKALDAERKSEAKPVSVQPPTATLKQDNSTSRGEKKDHSVDSAGKSKSKNDAGNDTGKTEQPGYLAVAKHAVNRRDESVLQITPEELGLNVSGTKNDGADSDADGKQNASAKITEMPPRPNKRHLWLARDKSDDEVQGKDKSLSKIEVAMSRQSSQALPAEVPAEIAPSQIAAEKALRASLAERDFKIAALNKEVETLKELRKTETAVSLEAKPAINHNRASLMSKVNLKSAM